MDDDIIQDMEIDLEIAHIGEILESHGVSPTAHLVVDLWDWAESLREAKAGDARG